MRNQSKSYPESNVGPVEDFIFNRRKGTYEPKLRTSKFIKGPIPFDWMAKANTLPGKAGPVGLGLRFLEGVQRNRSVKLTGEVEVLAGCERKAVANALIQLEQAGLISVLRQPGMRPRIEILDIPVPSGHENSDDQ